MTAFFFGPQSRRLYGFHHPSAGFSAHGVVVCPPWGSEYQFAHRSLLVLSRRLAGAGRHVLRFDYSGTGDSAGDSTEGDLEHWVDDTVAAVDELRAVAGVDRIDLVGLRIGAAIAAQAYDRLEDPGRIVLWDPVVDGARWVEEAGGTRTSGDGVLEVDRAAVSPTLVQQMSALDSSAYERLPHGRTLVLFTGVTPEVQEAWVRALAADGGVEYRRLDQPSPWLEDDSIWTGKVPTESVREIAEWLG